MLIVVHELQTQVRQRILVGSRSLMVASFCPYIYKHLAPAGTVYVQLQDVSGNKIKDSNAVTITAINAANYWHGFYRFDLAVALQAGVEYYLALKGGGGYAYAAGAFVGWCNSFEFGNAFGATYSGAIGVAAPLGLRVWENRFISKGAP